ncbi:hypothetical protein SAMN02745121_01315 [Nannocystis exedens]|uniref:Uncharacterized protein n=1 Tax=Nannocystis exedens TaxID=54 RepID=A0A1I1UXQ8_9BACT|nr:hypothetical protein [Nannocystis exedens]PCC72106.1 hypothetical protein NAEX_05185 [Nannocystis exedens]SFD74488.1 hypothetical protein SAMN02745121_01315 [Nannocystis exedens]
MADRAYEREDLADHRRGLRVAGAIVGGLLIGGFSVAGLAARVFGPAPGEGTEGAVPTDALRQLRATAEAEWAARAAAWEWLDPRNGVARIPVARAVELSLARGFPTRRDPPRPVTARTLR